MGVRVPVVTSTVRTSSWMADGQKEASGSVHRRTNVSFAAHLGDKDEFTKGAQVNQGSGVDDVKGEDFGA